MMTPWRMAVGEDDGQPSVIALRQDNGSWVPSSIVRIEVKDSLISRVVDYFHCPWVLPATLLSSSNHSKKADAYLRWLRNRNREQKCSLRKGAKCRRKKLFNSR